MRRPCWSEHWIDIAPPFAEAHFHHGFPQPDKRFHFAPDWRAIGPDWARMPTLPDYMPATDEATPDRPFRMVTAPARQFLNTSFTETPTSRQREGRPTVLLHPADAARAGIADGDRVRLGNARGEVVLHARLFDGLQPGVVVAESVWPNAAFEGGIGINALTSDDPAPPMGGAVFHDTAVWLRARLRKCRWRQIEQRRSEATQQSRWRCAPSSRLLRFARNDICTA